jgi:hypothetical protein
MIDANDLRIARDAIRTLEACELLSPRQAKAVREKLRITLSDEISKAGDRNHWDIAGVLNEEYRRLLTLIR